MEPTRKSSDDPGSSQIPDTGSDEPTSAPKKGDSGSATSSQADGSSEDDGREDLENAQDAKDADDESDEDRHTGLV